TLRDRLSIVYIGDDGEALFTSHVDQLEWVLWYASWLSDQLEWVLWYAPWLSDQLEWICGMLFGLVINWSSSAIETSRNHVISIVLDWI
ncbi:hypothetical protein Tco_1512704, partial [Tanacetum coccineum]